MPTVTDAIRDRLAATLSGTHTIERSDADLAARLARTDSLLLDVAGLSREGRTIANFVLARAYKRTNRPADALRVMRRRDGQLAYAFLASERLRRTARLAEEVGNRDEAMIALRNFIAMREKADPQFQPEVQQVRERLARLEAQAKR